MKFDNATVSVDVSATREFFQNLPIIQCDCQNCMNYKLAISKIPKECKDMLDSLGIDPLRIFGVETFQEAGESFIEYHCHTLLVGKISPATISDDKYITYQTNAFHLMAKREHSSYMNEVENIPGRSFTLIFVITLPWILQ